MQAQAKFRSVLTCFPLLLVCSCSDPSLSWLMIDSYCVFASQTESVPERVPPELLAEDADPSVASQKPNTLKDVPLGTVVDGLANLDGCWAHQYFDEDIEYWDVMKFDMGQQRLYYHRLLPTEESIHYVAPLSFITTQPSFFSEVWEVSVIGDNMLELNKISGEGATFNSEGETSFYCPAVGGSMENYLTAIATLDGDNLKYLESFETLDPDDPSNEDWAGYWVRFECPE